MPLDSRLQRALVRLGFTTPSPIQSLAIPLALVEGKDVVANARTGSGKTAAYLLPVLNKILAAKGAGRGPPPTEEPHPIQALVLVPTKELATQVLKATLELTQYCRSQVRALNLVKELDTNKGVEPSSLFLPPHPPSDLLITTPSRLSTLLTSLDALPTPPLASRLLFQPSTFASLVLDECDLLVGYGYAEDLRRIIGTALAGAGGGVQRWLVSATAMAKEEGKEADWVKEFAGDAAAVVTVKGDERAALAVPGEEGKVVPGTAKVVQYFASCPTDAHKFHLLHLLLTTRCFPLTNHSRVLIFAADPARCYRVRLFLEQFAVRAAVVDEGMPLASRMRVIEGVGQGVYGVVITSDIGEGAGGEQEDAELEEEDGDGEQGAEGEDGDSDDKDETAASAPAASKKRSAPSTGSGPVAKRSKKASTSSRSTFHPSRGLDFRRLDCVINLDLPSSPSHYLHRIGRTARGSSSGGVAITMWTQPNPKALLERDESVSQAREVERIKRDERVQARGSVEVLKVDQGVLEGFRYRVGDALRAVTKVAVREARVKEVRREMVESEKLKAHFSSNPDDLKALRSDRPLHPARVHHHLKHIPSYLAPPKKQGGGGDSGNGVDEGQRTNWNTKSRRGNGKFKGPASKAQKRRMDPLKSFAFKKTSA
ncbi:P-loop containing nucleoside triphosphate hydrolase protein [Gonapodya prolifera JEL478]|uniref:RNA helicase n=1 Tax=Gonapodya prolifera (strain JEL478) TaxID=1344416 RepID=A0A139AWY6_GONPJ|nr:P-loop containing nucleoside triphosphate hydrolase protein [Gonapodya prolifera JEL478]|eukprot:KXS21256.1 P-loop containing nucleoside triphosphate hydrolase protein [Gonapodya prolifera JEL478]